MILHKKSEQLEGIMKIRQTVWFLKSHPLWVTLYISMNGFMIRILTVIRHLGNRPEYYSSYPNTKIEFTCN